MKEQAYENSRIIIHEVADMSGIAFVSVQGILKDSLSMCWIAIKFVLYLLREQQKDSWVNAC